MGRQSASGQENRGMSEEELMSVFDMIFCGIIIVDYCGTVVFCNVSALEILNVDRERIQGGRFDRLEFLARLNQAVGNLLLGCGRYTVKDGGHSVVCNINPWFQQKKRCGSILILHQSHNPNCIVQELSVTNELLREINIFIESSYDGFLVTDSKGEIIRVNKAFEEALSMERVALVGHHIHELIEWGLYHESAVLEVCRTKKVATTVIRMKNKEMVETATPVFGQDGSLESVVANLRDMTELNELKNKLEQQTRMAKGYYKQLISIGNKANTENAIVAESKTMKNILHIINMISDVDSTVLITGESGTGKEVVVNEIYKKSRRNDHPIIKINCSAIPSALFESELFGYEGGSFTGARKDGKTGFFELADGGTLFMDEVGELDMEVQAKLLRVIQEKEIYRVGGSKPVKVDVRLIAATNIDLWQMIQEKKFRKDLYYRLNVINIDVPPLRERREDIIPLSLFFLERYNQKHHRHKKLSLELGQMLQNLDWLGNIRELENFIENLVVLTEGELLTLEHVPARYRVTPDYDNQIVIKGILPLKDMLAEAEKQLLQNAKDRFATTREMAKALGVDQSTISRKMQKYLHK